MYWPLEQYPLPSSSSSLVHTTARVLSTRPFFLRAKIVRCLLETHEITQGLRLRARTVNQLSLLESLIESKVASKALIPEPQWPPPPPSNTRGSPSRSPSGGFSHGRKPSFRVSISSSMSDPFRPATKAGGQGLPSRASPPGQPPPPSPSPSPSRQPTGGASASSAFEARGTAAGRGGRALIGGGGVGKLERKSSSWVLSDEGGARGGVVDPRSRSVVSRVFDGRGSADGGSGGRESESSPGRYLTPETDEACRPRSLGEAFREGELQCECKHSRRFALNHRLRGDKVATVLVQLDSKTLAHCKVHDRVGLYVYPDMKRNIFYITLSEVSREASGLRGRSCRSHLFPSSTLKSGPFLDIQGCWVGRDETKFSLPADCVSRLSSRILWCSVGYLVPRCWRRWHGKKERYYLML